jgi:hypothetical protein
MMKKQPMKRETILALTTLAFAAACGPLRAENESAPPPPPPPPAGEAGAGPGPGPDGPGKRLDPEQREKVKAAILKANADPRVQAARDDMKAAMEDLQTTANKAMLAADPTLGPTLEKLDTARKEHREKLKTEMAKRMAKPDAGSPEAAPPPPPRRPEGEGKGPGGFKREGFRRGGPGGPGGPGGFFDPALKSLPEEERQKLRAAHDKVKDNPEIKAAMERVEKSRAVNREAMRAALIAADPSLTPIMEELQKMIDRWHGGGPHFKPHKGGGGSGSEGERADG